MNRAPTLVRDEAELWDVLGALHEDEDDPRHALVPTMGALHDGHAVLIRRARELAPHVVVSIFVNPLQFGPGEDLDRYPRDLQADLARCAREGVDVVYAPDAGELYPDGAPRVRVCAGELGERLEGAARPGHFDGVLTVVLKLVNIVTPDVLVLGEKDAQQLALVRRMVRDLDVEVGVVGVPTVRERDGLALSSRNAYLSPGERERALALSRALAAGAERAGAGADAVLAAAGEVLAAQGVTPDYLCLVEETSFEQVRPPHHGPARLLVAARFGTTRLLDNTPLHLGTPTG